jgi:hypothetical protein
VTEDNLTILFALLVVPLAMYKLLFGVAARPLPPQRTPPPAVAVAVSPPEAARDDVSSEGAPGDDPSRVGVT